MPQCTKLLGTPLSFGAGHIAGVVEANPHPLILVKVPRRPLAKVLPGEGIGHGSTLEREEWKAFSDFVALVAAGLCALVGLIWAVAGKDPVMRFHGCLLLGAAGLAFLYILTQVIERSEPPDRGRLFRRGDPRRGDRHRVLGARRLPGRRHHRLAARLSGAQSRSALDELRTLASAAYLGRHLRLRRQRAASPPRSMSCSAPAVRGSRGAGRPGSCSGATSCSSCWRHRLSARRHASEGICRARMVRRPLADHRLGRLFPRLRRHARQKARAAHLRGELVLSRLHRHHRHAAHRQQSGGAGLDAGRRRATWSIPACRTP